MCRHWKAAQQKDFNLKYVPSSPQMMDLDLWAKQQERIILQCFMLEAWNIASVNIESFNHQHKTWCISWLLMNYYTFHLLIIFTLWWMKLPELAFGVILLVPSYAFITQIRRRTLFCLVVCGFFLIIKMLFLVINNENKLWKTSVLTNYGKTLQRVKNMV